MKVKLKVSSVVVFLLTGVMSYAQQPTTSKNNQQDCTKDVLEKIEGASGECSAKDFTDCNSQRQAIAYKSCKHLPDKTEVGSVDALCREAFKEYSQSRRDEGDVCEGLLKGIKVEGDPRKVCLDKIAKCQKLAKSTSSKNSQDETGMLSSISIFEEVVGGEDSSVKNSKCLLEVDTKDARDIEKEFRDRRKELEKDKKEIEDQRIKDKEDNDKELTRLTKEIQELSRNNKETLAKADVRMREQLNSSQKDIVDSVSRLRNLTTQISKKSDSVRQLNFAFTDRLLDASAQKRNLRCKSALDQAKACMIKSAKGIKDESCKDFPFSIKSKGPKATAELKAQLQIVNDACYEKEERDKKKLNFDQQEQLKRVNDEMAELQAQAKEEGQRQTIQSENSTKLSQEAEREKQEAQANMAEQQATLQGEMYQFAQKLEAKQERSRARLSQLMQDLEMLQIEEKTGMRSQTRLASKAVRNSVNNLEEVKAMCDCDDNFAPSPNASSAQARMCASAKRSIPTGGSEEEPTKPSRSGQGKR